ncbi:monocarboxylate transporter 13-like [Mercenaria mercenaria]|uniref:monocarboxylate transporter 13-like n=1 Tax=Mercenaria mercenaria TaxID=6596 RepID=UPI00234FAF69|nr:monocarboxylate transporter 13-like [Mercenaria mercenaria]
MIKSYRRTDGGWGWIVVAGAFCSHVITFGIIYSFGILFLSLEENFDGTKSEIAWIPSLTSGSLHSSGLLASILVNRFGCRVVTLIGAITCSIGYILSIFATNIYCLYVTMGLIAGCGFGMVFMPAVLIVTQYFSRLRSLACGIALSGCGIGAFIFSPLLKIVLDEYSLKGTLLILSAIMLNCISCGLLFLPISPEQVVQTKQSNEKSENADELYSLVDHERNAKDTTCAKDFEDGKNEYMECTKETYFPKASNADESDVVFNDNMTISDVRGKEDDDDTVRVGNSLNKSDEFVIEHIIIEQCDRLHKIDERSNSKSTVAIYFELMKRGEMVIFFISQFHFIFGFYLPFIFIPDKAKGLGISEKSSAWVASVIGISSICGRIILGYIADRPSVNRLLMFKITLLISGISTALGPVLNSLWLMMLYAVIYGVSTGFTISVTSVILFDLVGLEYLAEALGMVSLFSGVGSVLGPPFAGFLYDSTGSYTAPFLASGASMSLAGVLMFLPPLFGRKQK